MSDIKERLILFSGPMVRAIIEGRKNVTRRVVKPMPLMVTDHNTVPWEGDPGALLRLLTNDGRRCPYGQPGDRLWVRESTEADYNTHDAVTLARYCADKSPVLYLDNDDGEPIQAVAHWNYPRDVRPSIHMHRAQARIILEVTDVRVERLQDLSNEQALAEGVQRYAPHTEVGDWYHIEDAKHYSADPRETFASLWESINGNGAWCANPWVWVVEFKRIS